MANTIIDLTDEQWLARCVQRYIDKGKMSAQEAAGAAELCQTIYADQYPDNPEAAADEDMASLE